MSRCLPPTNPATWNRRAARALCSDGDWFAGDVKEPKSPTAIADADAGKNRVAVDRIVFQKNTDMMQNVALHHHLQQRSPINPSIASTIPREADAAKNRAFDLIWKKIRLLACRQDFAFVSREAEMTLSISDHAHSSFRVQWFPRTDPSSLFRFAHPAPRG